jgi:hypothetical protein
MTPLVREIFWDTHFIKTPGLLQSILYEPIVIIAIIATIAHAKYLAIIVKNYDALAKKVVIISSTKKR